MSLLEKIKSFFLRLFCIKREEGSNVDDISFEESTSEPEESSEQFKVHNIVFEKLNYLEQYIKIFSLPFPKEYNHYLQIIQTERSEYEAELKDYSEGLLGEITFAIDPEHESKRLITVCNLEEEIVNFVELVFNFSVYKGKFSKLCCKLNQFYNALLDTEQEIDVITSQLDNAINAMNNLITKVKDLYFFKTDTRKREIILNHIIYGEYIFLKSYLRCGLTQDFYDYKKNLSKFHSLFIANEYDRLIFKFFIEDLEQYQLYITSNLACDKMYNNILKSCQSLQTRLNNYLTIFYDPDFFKELINFENTVDTISENSGMDYLIPLPEVLENSSPSENSASVKDTAASVLSMLNCNKAKILYKVVLNFKTDISWREFYFLCKIFELYDEVIKIAHNTIFTYVVTKFLSLDSRYSDYSDSFIKSEKQKLLNYHGRKSKKYVYLLSSEASFLPTISHELRMLNLDFLVSGNKIYINHSYFNGFQNLEENFGHYKLLEELL